MVSDYPTFDRLILLSLTNIYYRVFLGEICKFLSHIYNYDVVYLYEIFSVQPVYRV